MPPSASDEPIIIRGHDHDHRFKYHEQKGRGSTYECNGCKQPGLESYYKCTKKNCNVYYHQLCGDLLRPDSSAAPVANHDPYPTGLVFEETAPRGVWFCVACGDQLRGIKYEVGDERSRSYRAFHPLCASLPAQTQETGEPPIVLELKERIQGECSICKGIAKGWAYNSTCGNLCYHVGCWRKKIIQSLLQDEASQNGGKKRKARINWKKVWKILKMVLKLGLTIAEFVVRLLGGSANWADFIKALNEML